VLLSSDIAAFAAAGADEIRTLIKQLEAGVSPQSLGIAWSPYPSPPLFATLRLTLFDSESQFPLDEIATLTGFGRRLAETIIAQRLEDRDPRVPPALVRLGATWTIPALEEVANSATIDAEFRGHVGQAVRALRAL
jgi:hypothetical protein